VSGQEESKGYQEDALWRQATNGSSLEGDWAILVLDRLSLAVKKRPALTMNLDRYMGRLRGA